jgi:hypothetical protein
MNSVFNPQRLAERQQQALKPKSLWVLAEFVVVGICTLAFALTAAGICVSLLGKDSAGLCDFVTYWSSGHQLVHRANPYDANAVSRLERTAGYPPAEPPLIMPNPPTSLPLVLPLGVLGPESALLLWTLLSLGCLIASVFITWTMHGRPTTPLNLLGYSFGPAMVCLAAGQVSLIVLLGLALFLHLHTSRPFYAGAALWLCMLKPHLFGVVLLAWVIVSRNYKILIGLATALCISTAIAMILDPLVWTHYKQMMSVMRADRVPIPCFSIALRRTLSPEATWLQFLPVSCGIVWALAYYRGHRGNWDWIVHGSPLMILSVLVAPYTWLVDQAILIPALLHAIYLTRSRALIALLALASAAIQVGIFRGGTQLLHSPFYLWAAPAWLVWYLCAVRQTNRKRDLETLEVTP